MGGGSGQGGLVGAAIRVRAERFGLGVRAERFGVGVRACHDRDEDAPAEVRVHALRRGEPLELLRRGPLRPLVRVRVRARVRVGVGFRVRVRVGVGVRVRRAVAGSP